MATVKPNKLDAWDRKIIYYLEVNGRSPVSEIAHAVGLSKQTTHYRLKSLIKNGIIASFITQLDIAKFGFTNFEIWIQLRNMNEEKRKEIIDSLSAHPNTRWVASCAGRWDIAVAILARNVHHFNELFLDLLLNRYGEDIRNADISIVTELHNFRRAHLIGTRKDLGEATFFGGEQTIAEMSPLDLRVLNVISADARLPIQDIAGKVGAAPPTVRARLKRLVKSGVITGFKAFVHPSSIGIENHEILISLQNLTPKREKELLTFCADNPRVIYFIKCVGKWGLDISIDVDNALQLQEFVNDLREKFSDVLRDFDTVQIVYDYKFNYLPPLG